MTQKLASLLLCGAIGCTSSQDVCYVQSLNNIPAAQKATVAAALDAIEGASQLAALASLSFAASSAAAVSQLPGDFSTPGCVTHTTPSAGQVQFKFTDCSGPYNLEGLSGTLTVTYLYQLNTLTTTLNGVLHIGCGTLTLSNAQALGSTPMGFPLNLTITAADSTEAGQSGQVVPLSGSYTTSWDSRCVTLAEGGSFNNLTISSPYQRCLHTCPQAGVFQITTSAANIQLTYGNNSNTPTDTAQALITTVPLGLVTGPELINLALTSPKAADAGPVCPAL